MAKYKSILISTNSQIRRKEKVNRILEGRTLPVEQVTGRLVARFLRLDRWWPVVVRALSICSFKKKREEAN